MSSKPNAIDLTSDERSTLRKLLYQTIFKLEEVAYSTKYTEEEVNQALQEMDKNYAIISKLINMDKLKLKENAHEYLGFTS